MKVLPVLVFLGIPIVCSAIFCSMHYCFHDHHCCSFNCTIRGCVCLPNGSECKFDGACCSKICHRTGFLSKFGTCKGPGEITTSTGASTTSTGASTTKGQTTEAPDTTAEPEEETTDPPADDEEDEFTSENRIFT